MAGRRLGSVLALLSIATSIPALASPAPPAGDAAPGGAPTRAVERALCRSGMYLDTTLSVGATLDADPTRITRGRAGLGYRHEHCTDLPASEGYHLRIGIFAEGGTEELGDAYQVGPEVEYNNVLGRGWRGGARIALGFGGVVTVAAGPRFRHGPLVLGADLVYSSPGSDGQTTAVGLLGTVGVGGKSAGFVAVAVGLLLLYALANFNTT